MTKLEYIMSWLMSHPFKPTGTIHNQHEKVGRNQLCPCGSKIKSKKCCGRMKNDLSIHLQREECRAHNNRPGIGQADSRTESYSVES